MGQTILIALGGNAFVRNGQRGTALEQLHNLDSVAGQIVNLHNRGFHIVLTHGNGPQVGQLLLAQEKAQDYAPQMPLSLCVAMTQGMMGAMLQEALYNHLKRRGFNIPVVTIITQVLVDAKDPGFSKPSKPIGPFYPDRTRLPKDWQLTHTLKGFRRVVASPKPKEIIEAKEIRKIAKQAMVIACGGGGIPVIKDRGLKGVEAVIDKDLTAAKLAEVVDAQSLVILTDEDFVYRHYGKPSQKKIEKATLSELKTYSADGEFPAGSMGPKIQAAIRFLDRGGKRAIITSLNRLEDSINGDWGTHITP